METVVVAGGRTHVGNSWTKLLAEQHSEQRRAQMEKENHDTEYHTLLHLHEQFLKKEKVVLSAKQRFQYVPKAVV